MERRTLLGRLAAITATGALAGCLDDGAGAGNGTNDGDETNDGAGGDGTGNGDESGADDGAEDGADEGNDNDTEDGGDDEVGNGSDGGNGADGGRADGEIKTVDAGCADGEGAESTASVSFDGTTVEVTGTVGASDPCHEAVIESVTLEDGDLTVEIGVESDDDGACQQCLGRLEYEATLEFDDPPESATVLHRVDGETTTAAEADREE